MNFIISDPGTYCLGVGLELGWLQISISGRSDPINLKLDLQSWCAGCTNPFLAGIQMLRPWYYNFTHVKNLKIEQKKILLTWTKILINVVFNDLIRTERKKDSENKKYNWDVKNVTKFSLQTTYKWPFSVVLIHEKMCRKIFMF